MAFVDYLSYATLLDSGVRANEGPPPSASWASNAFSAGTSQLQIVSNAIKRGGAGYGSGAWGTQLGPDVIYYVTLSTLGDIELEIRGKDLGSGSTWDAYSLFYENATHTFTLYRTTNGSASSLATSTSKTLSAGDKLGLMAIGSNLTSAVYQSGAWSDHLTASDATYGSSGYVGFWLNGTTPAVNDMYGGTITAGKSPAYPRRDSMRLNALLRR